MEFDRHRIPNWPFVLGQRNKPQPISQWHDYLTLDLIQLIGEERNVWGPPCIISNHIIRIGVGIHSVGFIEILDQKIEHSVQPNSERKPYSIISSLFDFFIPNARLFFHDSMQKIELFIPDHMHSVVSFVAVDRNWISLSWTYKYEYEPSPFRIGCCEVWRKSAQMRLELWKPTKWARTKERMPVMIEIFLFHCKSYALWWSIVLCSVPSRCHTLNGGLCVWLSPPFQIGFLRTRFKQRRAKITAIFFQSVLFETNSTPRNLSKNSFKAVMERLAKYPRREKILTVWEIYRKLSWTSVNTYEWLELNIILTPNARRIENVRSICIKMIATIWCLDFLILVVYFDAYVTEDGW